MPPSSPAQVSEAQSAWPSWWSRTLVAPAFVPADNRPDWEQQRRQVRKQLEALLGQLPPRPAKPVVVVKSREERSEYVVEKFSFDNEAGATVPGYLIWPRTLVKPRPAILYCHWHGGEYAIGKEEIFQSTHTPEVPALALAKRGYVVMAIDAYGFGERSGQGPGGPKETGGAEELTASKFNLWVGRTLWGMIVRDDLMALDYLVSRPEVDPQKVAVTGISMGATRSWWLTALDDRIKTGVAVACLTRYQNLIAHQALSAHGIYYFVPGLLTHFDTEAIVALAAPRPMLFMTGDQDAGSPADGVRKIGEVVSQIYRLYGMEADFQNLVYPGLGHVYTADMWSKMLAWMDARLK